MKRASILAVILIIAVSALPLTAFAEGAGAASVFVTISGADGELKVSRAEISVTDTDGDGAITINDALYLAHEEKYSGGAKAGYASKASDYGVSITKLWGAENDSGYGYYVNNAPAFSLADSIKDGDSIVAFVYTDLIGFSDSYSYFGTDSLEAKKGEEFTIALTATGYDENWNFIASPFEGATIEINGEVTSFTTDENGLAKIKIDTEGTYVISAFSETTVLVPPVCAAVILEGESGGSSVEDIAGTESGASGDTVPQTGDVFGVGGYILLIAAAFAGIAYVGFGRRRA